MTESLVADCFYASVILGMSEDAKVSISSMVGFLNSKGNCITMIIFTLVHFQFLGLGDLLLKLKLFRYIFQCVVTAYQHPAK